MFLLHLIAGVREYVGAHKRIMSALHRMETSMANATEQIAATNAKVTDLIADVRAALAVINQDELSDTAQAELDSLNAKLDGFDTEIGDKDGSDTQPLPVPDEPTV